VITVKPVTASDLILSVSEGSASCGVSCIDSINRNAFFEPETYSYRAGSQAQTLYFTVEDVTRTEGDFTIEATLSP
jgi:hypothetical protein